MSTNFGIIKQHSVPSQSGRSIQDEVQVSVPNPWMYDQLLWAHDPHTGQPYSLAQLVANDTLPLPQSQIN